MNLASLVRRSAPLLFISVLSAGGHDTAPPEKKRLTLEQTMGAQRVNFGGSAPAASFAWDGRHVEMAVDGKPDAKKLWLDPKTLATSEPEPAPAKKEVSGKQDAVPPLTALDALKKVAGFDATKAHNALLAPGGKHASYVADNNVYIADVESGKARAITSDGGPERLNGVLDWVYQEEVYGRGNFQACWWSPDGSRLAFLSIDESGVPHHPIVDHIPQHPELEDTRYPKSGDPNPKATLHVVRGKDGSGSSKPVAVDLSKYAADQPLIVRVGWTPDGKRVCFEVQDREQTWLDLDLADPDNGRVTTLFRETSAKNASWVDRLDPPRWLADGSFLWLSERTGFKHVYHYAADGKPLGALTSGEWEVRALTDVDEKAQRIWFTASKDSAIGPNLYRADYGNGSAGKECVRLTTGGGSHSVEWSSDKSYFLDRVSSLAFVPEVRLCAGEDGRVLKVLGKAAIPALDDYAYQQPELLQIPTRDGFLMDATLIAPALNDRTKKLPLWLLTYSGPDAPSVRDSWSGDPWAQFLAQEGYAFFQVNNRTSSQRGHQFTALCYQQLGVQELADLEDALAWLATHRPFLDTTRVGITGWSYGGFMTGYALTHSKAFKLGVAGAGVYDWRLYDKIYTERFMRTPEHDADGYLKTSCVEAAKDLSGYLVLAHGTIDDNVHVQNSMQFALALQKADKEFEMMMYPRSRHGLGSPEQNWHFRKLTWKAIRERL